MGERVDKPRVVTMEPSHGRDWDWHRELNILVLSPRLDAAGRQRAKDEFLDEVRRALADAEPVVA